MLFSIAAHHEKELRECRWQRLKKTHLIGKLGPDEVAFVQSSGQMQQAWRRTLSRNWQS